MASFFSLILYVLIFLSVYVQVFFIYTFFENRKKIKVRKEEISLSQYPSVTIIVPCWNEEFTVSDTIKSLLNIRYPKDKLKIMIIDDGSTDNTWSVISEFSKYENVSVLKKENGGKHTALNLGLERVDTPFVGCLDADSFAGPESLVRILSYFEEDPKSMAVAPSIIVHNPKNFVQEAQNAEYYMSVFLKKMQGFIGAIHVTPGPLTIFRKEVFEDLGPYRHAHNTEDMEIAYRMQKNKYKIKQCNDAYVYTNTPSTVKTLYKQRLRWIYGFLNNTIDYKGVLFKKRYGDFSLFTLPAGLISVFMVSILFGRFLVKVFEFLRHKFIHLQTLGFSFDTSFSFDMFYLNTSYLIFVTIVLYGMVFATVVLGHRMIKQKWVFPTDMFYFFILFSIIGPIWLLKAIYNTAISKRPSWR